LRPEWRKRKVPLDRPESDRYTPSDGTTHESQCGCRTKHETELFGPEPAFCKKGRQERRSKSEPTEECGVERHKSNEHAALHGHGSAGSSRGLGFEPRRLDGSLATMPGLRRSGHQSSAQGRQRIPGCVRDRTKNASALTCQVGPAGSAPRPPLPALVLPTGAVAVRWHASDRRVTANVPSA
jgi:hypothetical protein